MLKKRFILSFFLSTIVMMAASYVWHGLILNDLQFVPQPHFLFYTLAVLTYLIIGFALTFVYTYLSMGIGLKFKASLMGLAFGFCIYLIAFVFGVSFKGSGTEHVVVDFMWQMLEQGMGGATIGFIYLLAKRRDKFLAEASQ